MIREDLARGHAERIAPMVAETLTQAGIGMAEIDRIAVTIGPGTFTGVRVGVALARGLALRDGGRKIPLVGLSTLQAIAAGQAAVPGMARIAAIDARRGQIYAQAFDAALAELTEPIVASPQEASKLLLYAVGEGGASIAGSGAELLRDAMGAGELSDPAAQPDPAIIVALGAQLAPMDPLRPLYLRAPDAKPPKPIGPLAGHGR